MAERPDNLVSRSRETADNPSLEGILLEQQTRIQSESPGTRTRLADKMMTVLDLQGTKEDTPLSAARSLTTACKTMIIFHRDDVSCDSSGFENLAIIIEHEEEVPPEDTIVAYEKEVPPEDQSATIVGYKEELPPEDQSATIVGYEEEVLPEDQLATTVAIPADLKHEDNETFMDKMSSTLKPKSELLKYGYGAEAKKTFGTSTRLRQGAQLKCMYSAEALAQSTRTYAKIGEAAIRVVGEIGTDVTATLSLPSPLDMAVGLLVRLWNKWRAMEGADNITQGPQQGEDQQKRGREQEEIINQEDREEIEIQNH